MKLKFRLPDPDPNIPIVVFDLDGTLVESTWPHRFEIGPAINAGVDAMYHYANQGLRVEIHTARPERDHGLIWDWINKLYLPVDKVTCEKPFAGLYIDDRAWCPPWGKRREPPVTVDDEWTDDEITRLP